MPEREPIRVIVPAENQITTVSNGTMIQDFLGPCKLFIGKSPTNEVYYLYHAYPGHYKEGADVVKGLCGEVRQVPSSIVAVPIEVSEAYEKAISLTEKDIERFEIIDHRY